MGKMLSETGDNALALRAGEGDRAAFATLVERHYDRVFRLGWRLLGAEAEAEDLAQDVCIGLAAKLRSYRGDAAFATWLYRVVVNAARDRQRSHTRQGALSAAFAEVDALRRAGDAARAEEAEWLAEALAALKPDLRETAILVLDEGMSHGAAAEVLGIAETTVSWRMREIRKALKALAEAGEDVTP